MPLWLLKERPERIFLHYNIMQATDRLRKAGDDRLRSLFVSGTSLASPLVPLNTVE